MKRIILFSFIFFILIAHRNNAQQQGEGEVKFRIEYQGEAIQLDLFFAGTNFRIDKSDREGKSIYLAVNGLTGVLYPGQKIYMEYGDIKDKYLFENPPLTGKNKDVLKLTKTEEKFTVLGVECEKWILKNEITSVEMFVNRDIYFNKVVLQAFPRYIVDWQEVLSKENAYPLLVKIKDDLGNVIYTFEAVEINMRKLEKNTFVIPPGYQKIGIKKGKY